MNEDPSKHDWSFGMDNYRKVMEAVKTLNTFTVNSSSEDNVTFFLSDHTFWYAELRYDADKDMWSLVRTT